VLNIIGGVRFRDAVGFELTQFGAVIIFFPGMFRHDEPEVAASLGDT